eukprot:1050847_1
MCACFLTLLHLYFHFLFSTTKTDTISCNSDSACKSQTKYCTEGEHCYIECKGSSACNSATFHCPSGAFNCEVLCSGSTNLASSGGCISITIDGSASNGGNLIINGLNKPSIMYGLVVYCPSNGDCIISCHDSHGCRDGTIWAQPNTRLLSMECADDYYTC